MAPLHPDKQASVASALKRRAKRRMKTDPSSPSLIEALAVEVYNNASKKGAPGKKVDLVKGGTSADRKAARAAVANESGRYGAELADGGKAKRKALATEARSRRASTLLGAAPAGLDPKGKYIAVATASQRAVAGKDIFNGLTPAQRTAARKAAGISTRAQRYRKAAAAGKSKTGGTPAAKLY